jgi:DNA-binding Lrp family transcriptional regulator
MNVELDKRDLDLITMLRGNSRLSAREIARRLGISVGTVQMRLKKLEDSGIINKYTVDINLEKLGYQFPVLIDIKVSRGKIRLVEDELRKLGNVSAIYDITGEYDITIIARFRSRSDLDNFIKNLLEHKYIERTHTKLILNIICENKYEGYLKELYDGMSEKKRKR